MEPLISIVTPSFRQLDWLRLAIASVADQEGVECEHIVQDAGTPGIGPFLQTHFADLLADGRLTLAVEKDDGMYDAINRGLRRARGEICAYLNCDEQYLPGALASVANFLTCRNGPEILFADVILVNQIGRPISYRRSILPTQQHIRAAHLNTSSCATFFRRRIFDRGAFFEPKWKAIGDAVWMDSLLEQHVVMSILPQPTSVFTFTGENLGASETSRLETEKWRQTQPPNGIRDHLHWTILIHRLRKLFSGAYRRRRAAIDIYTLHSPNQRCHFEERSLGFSWPVDV